MPLQSATRIRVELQTQPSVIARLMVGVLLVLVIAPFSHAQVFSGSSVKVIERNRKKANHFAIMGQVIHPKAYLLPTSSPSLVDFVRFAGGLTKQASNGGQIRIIRNGRVAQQSFYNPRSTLRLMPGDLVIVDGKYGGGRIFKGGQSELSAKRKVQLGLVGVMDYPIIMQVKPDFATMSWVTRQLGQRPEVGIAAKAIVPRGSGKAEFDRPLADNSVIVFNQNLIDKTRLPNLPRPFKAGEDKQPGFADSDARPTPRPQPRSNANPSAPSRELSAAPPARTFSPPARTFSNQQPIADTEPRPGMSPGHGQVVAPAPPLNNPAEERAVRELLTDPKSVQLEPERYVRSNGDSKSGRNSNTRIDQPELLNRDQQDANNRAQQAQVAVERSPEAAKPFQSYLSSEEDGGVDVSEQRGNSSQQDAVVELPLQVARPNSSSQKQIPAEEPQDHDLQSIEPSRTTPKPIAIAERPQRNDTRPIDRTQVERQVPAPRLKSEPEPQQTEESGYEDNVNPSAGPSLAAQAAEQFDDRTEKPTTTRQPVATSPRRVPLTGPILVESKVAGTNPTAAPRVKNARKQSSSAVIARDEHASAATEPSHSASSRVIEKPTEKTSLPVLIISSIGGCGVLVAACMMLMLLKKSPDPEPTPIRMTDDQFLDRLIKNEVEIVEEPVASTPALQLFGKPTPDPILRLDAAHKKIRRPHFLDRGDQGGVSDDRPSRPDPSQPDGNDVEEPNSGPRPVTPVEPNQNPGRVPSVPVRPAAAAATLESAPHNVETGHSSEPSGVTGDEEPKTPTQTQLSNADPTSNKDPKPQAQRTFRIDGAHPVLKSNMSQEPKVVTIQPAPALAQGSDILDRVLQAVSKEQQ